MRFILHIIGELDLIGEDVGRFLGLVIYHGFMLSVTGGLWAFWLLYKFFIGTRRNRRRYY